MARFTRLCAVALMLAVVPSTADAALTERGSADVSFEATATGGLSIEGKTDELGVTEKQGKVEVTVPLATLSTGISLRDKHMREKYLEVDKYPNATLRITRSSLSFPSDGAELTKSVTGELTLHGQTNPAAFRYTALREGSVYRVAGAMRVDMRRHGIEQPSFMGITVSPEVAVRVRFEVKDEP